MNNFCKLLAVLMLGCLYVTPVTGQTCYSYGTRVYDSGYSSGTSVIWSQGNDAGRYQERRVYETPARRRRPTTTNRVYYISVPEARPQQPRYASSPTIVLPESTGIEAIEESDYELPDFDFPVDPPDIETPQPPASTAPAHVSAGRTAWRILADGRKQLAFTAFGELCSEYPGHAQYKLGYSLAAAGAGNDRTAIWAMRRTFALSANSIGPIPINANLAKMLDRVAAYYADLAATPMTNRDANFMLGAVNYLRHDINGALQAVEAARAYGDLNRSTINLRHILLADADVQ